MTKILLIALAVMTAGSFTYAAYRLERGEVLTITVRKAQ